VTRRERLAVLEAASVITDRAREPHTIEVSVELASPLDAQAVRAGLAAAIRAHAMATVSLDQHHPWTRQLFWTFHDDIDDSVLDRALIEHRGSVPIGAAASEMITLQHPPPLRLHRSSDGVHLTLAVNHAAFDGIGAVRFLVSVTRHARGVADPLPVEDPVAVRGLLGEQSPGITAVRADESPIHLARLGVPGAPGCHVVHRAVPVPPRPLEGTINDVLLGGLHVSIDRWQRRHDAPAGPIRVLVPVSARPAHARHEHVANLALLTSFTTGTHEHDSRLTDAFNRALGVVSGGSQAMRAAAGIDPWTRRLGAGRLPYAVARTIAAAGSWASRTQQPTATLSNLGSLPTDLIDGTGIRHLWFGPPCREPRGLAVGVATIGGTLHLSFRGRTSTFDMASLSAYADDYVSTVSRVTAEGP
jgi:NRPS condensation-like uncharacterized protein